MDLRSRGEDAAFVEPHGQPMVHLRSRAWEEIQAGRLTVDTARAVQEGVTVYAIEAGVGRYEVEMGLKKAVRHPAGT